VIAEPIADFLQDFLVVLRKQSAVSQISGRMKDTEFLM
jgi:hypothetical protein